MQKYKKWILALAIWQLIPLVLLVSGVMGSVIYHYVNDDTHFHSYKSYIVSGFEDGLSDGKKDSSSVQNIPLSPWSHYDYETRMMVKQVIVEKQEYLAQFPEEERGARRAEMRLNNTKSSLQIELAKRTANALNFYANYVKRIIQRGNFNSDKEYQVALEQEAWKVGYAEGYRQGLYNMVFSKRSIDSFKNYHTPK